MIRNDLRAIKSFSCNICKKRFKVKGLENFKRVNVILDVTCSGCIERREKRRKEEKIRYRKERELEREREKKRVRCSSCDKELKREIYICKKCEKREKDWRKTTFCKECIKEEEKEEVGDYKREVTSYCNEAKCVECGYTSYDLEEFDLCKICNDKKKRCEDCISEHILEEHRNIFTKQVNNKEELFDRLLVNSL